MILILILSAHCISIIRMRMQIRCRCNNIDKIFWYKKSGGPPCRWPYSTEVYLSKLELEWKTTAGKSAGALWAWIFLWPTWQWPNAPNMIGQCVIACEVLFLQAVGHNGQKLWWQRCAPLCIIVHRCKTLYNFVHNCAPLCKVVQLCATLYNFIPHCARLYNFVRLQLENWNLLLHWERTTSTASISVSVFFNHKSYLSLLIFSQNIDFL